MAKREKHTFTSGSELAHAWAHQTVREGRRSDGRMYFDSDEGKPKPNVERVSTIYSYGRHYAAGTLYRTKASGTVALLNSNSYSISTSKHMSYVRYAVSHLPTFYVNDPRELSGVREWYSRQIVAAERSARDPKTRRTMPFWNEAHELACRANSFAEVFGYSWRFVVDARYTVDELKRAEELEEKALEAQKRRDAKRELAAQTRATREREQLNLALIEWRKNPAYEPPYNIARAEGWTAEDAATYQERVRAKDAAKLEEWRGGGGNGWDLKGTYLRLDDDTIYTSKGARFPAAHGAKAWPLIKRIHDKNLASRTMPEAPRETWHANGHSIHLGPYTITSIEPDGTVRAGCHLVPYAEIERIAELMGLPT